MKLLIIALLLASCATKDKYICRQGVIQKDKGGYFAPHLGANGYYTECK